MAKPVKHYNKWRIRWADENGFRRSEVYSDFKSASYELKKREAEVEEIKRGLRSPIAPNKSFQEICSYWIQNRLPQKRNKKDDLSIINNHLIPVFGKLKLTEITLDKVDRFVSTKGHLSKKTISNHLTLLISMLRLAVELGWLHKMPNIKKPRVHLFSEDYSFLRTNEEIERFLKAAQVEDRVAHLMYKTAIYTGLRAGELAALKFSNIKFDGNKSLITVQNSFDGLTKSGKVRYVPVLAPILQDLLEWRNQELGDLVFPNRDGNMFLQSGRIFQEVLHRVLDRAGFQQFIKNGRRRRYIVFHDLRHTFASHWVMNGGDIFKLQHILGHSDIKMTMRYAHLAPHAFVNDFERMGCDVKGLANVVPFKS